MNAPPRSTDALLQTLYSDLRGMAEKKLDRERVGHTLQATAMVNWPAPQHG